MNGCFTIVLATPILPGKSEQWRRWLQEIMELNRPHYEESRRRLGITSERVWIVETVNGNVAIIAVVAAHPEQVLLQIATSDLPFDRRYREQLLALQGFDLTKVLSRASPKLILEWHASKQ
jgi:hypothetical protein